MCTTVNQNRTHSRRYCTDGREEYSANYSTVVKFYFLIWTKLSTLKLVKGAINARDTVKVSLEADVKL